MEYKASPTYEPVIDGRTAKGISAVFGNVDMGRDRIFYGAFRKTLKENNDRVRYLWQHDVSNPPVAVIRGVSEVKKQDLPEVITKEHPEVTGGLMVVREYLDTPRGDEILAGLKAGAIREMSFGFDPVKFDFEEEKDAEGKATGILVRNLRELRLWDISDVNWGMNPLTVGTTKSAVPYKDTGKAAESVAWNAPSLGDFTGDMFEDLSSAEKSRIEGHYAFTVNVPPETFADLKLPHHQASTSGIGPAVWRGVSAAMGALMGARGGADIPDADRRSVYNHLSKHYSQFDKEPPDFKLVELCYQATTVLHMPELKEGRVLSSRNLERLKGALEVLSEILLAAEPSQQDAEKAEVFTAQLEARLKLYESEIYLMR